MHVHRDACLINILSTPNARPYAIFRLDRKPFFVEETLWSGGRSERQTLAEKGY